MPDLENAVFVIEEALIDALADPDTAMVLYREGIDTHMLLKDEVYGTRLLTFVIKFINEHQGAPSPKVLKEEFPEVTFQEQEIPVEYLIEKIKNRYAFNLAQQVIDRTARALSEDPIGAVKLGIRELTKIDKEVKEASPVIYVQEWEQQLVDYKDRVARGKLSGFTFGYPEIDERLGGIKGLTFNVGLTKRFKSWMLMIAAIENMKQGAKACFFSLEMTKEEMYDRFCCLMTDLSYFKRANGGWDADTMALFELRMSEMEDLLNMPIYHPPESERTVPGLMEIARQEEADLVVIDQYSFLRSHRVEKGMSEHAGHHLLCTDLKLAANAQCPIYIAAQFNREAASLAEMGEMHQIALSHAIPEKADTMMAVHQTKDMKQSFPQILEFGTIGARAASWGSWHLSVEMGNRCSIEMKEEKRSG